LFVFEETQKLKSIIDFHNDNKSNDPDLIIQDDSIKSIYKNLTKDNPENYSLYSSSQNTIDTLIFRDNNNCLIKIIISFPRIDIVYLIDRYFPEYSLLVNNFRTPYYRSIICDKTGKVEYTSGIYSWKYSHSNPDDMTGFNWRFYADSDNKSDLEFAFVGNSRNENDFFGRIRWVYNPSNLGSVLALPPDSIEPFQTTLIKFYKK